MVSVCLPSDALLQHLPSYLGFSYLGRGVSLQGCSSKVQPLLLTLDGYLLTATPPDVERGVAPLGPPAQVQPPLLRCGVPPPSRCPWPRMRSGSFLLLLRRRSLALSAATPDLSRGVAPPHECEGLWRCTGDRDQDHPHGKEMQKDKMVVWGGLKMAEKRREAKGKEKRKDIPIWMQSSKQ